MNKNNNILLFESWLEWVALNESSYDNQGFSESNIMEIQTHLVNNLFMNQIRTNGKPSVDGKFGSESREALIKYQQSKNLSPNGLIDNATLASMNLSFSVPSQEIKKDTIEYGVEQKLSINKDNGEDIIEIIDPSIIKVVFESDFKRLSINEWIQRGYKNFINLTFFESTGKPTSNFFSNGINYGAKLDTLGKWWPLMITKPEIKIIDDIKEMPNPIEAFSGSHYLVKDGNINIKRQGPKESAHRPRTAVGITSNNEIIVMVTPSSDLIGFAKKLQSAGAYQAINLDGGGSSLFVRNGEALFSTSRPVPTILTW
jgi:exopolysaccharide biosynthesis protein